MNFNDFSITFYQILSFYNRGSFVRAMMFWAIEALRSENHLFVFLKEKTQREVSERCALTHNQTE